MSLVKPKPFTKWVGGKGGLLEQLTPLLPPERPKKYAEPFLGGGALFYELSDGLEEALLGDMLDELVCAYQEVKTDVEGFIVELEGLQRLWDAGGRTKELFKQLRDRDRTKMTPRERGAWLLFITRFGFNGMFRLNQFEKCTIPMGDNPRAQLCDPDVLRAASAALQKATIRCSTYEWILGLVDSSWFVYIDSPYHPVSKTSSFTSYNAGGFSQRDQEKLARTYRLLTSRGVKVMLSNSATPLIRDLYKDFDVRNVMSARSINSHAEKRGEVEEVVVLNYTPACDVKASK